MSKDGTVQPGSIPCGIERAQAPAARTFSLGACRSSVEVNETHLAELCERYKIAELKALARALAVRQHRTVAYRHPLRRAPNALDEGTLSRTRPMTAWSGPPVQNAN